MKNKSIRILCAAALCLAMLFSLAACGTSSPANSQPDPNSEPVQDSAEPKAALEAAAEEPEVYTIRFDLNTTADPSDDELYRYEESGYDENWQPITTEKEAVFTVPAGDDAYLDVSLPDPTREGYWFAGWQTRPDVTEADLVNGVSPYLWLMGQKLSFVGQGQVEISAAEEIEERQLNSEVMPLSKLESLDADGNGTLYARWVELTPISTEEELRAIANDLYGAYELTADIELTAPWTPVGCYFQNYEYFESNWWNFAFRGTLLGNRHSISGLQVLGAAIDSDQYRTENTASVWHNDGMTCDGTAAMFGAITKATIQDLTILSPVIDVSGEYSFDGEYCYAAVLAAFDMDSVVSNVAIEDAQIRVETTEKSALYRDSLYATVAGMNAGGWNTHADGCSFSGNIELSTDSVKSHGGTVYLGGLIGECYAYMNGCSVHDTSLTLNSTDSSEAAEDTAFTVNMGGFCGSNTSSSGNMADVKLAVNVSKPVGASSVNVGGYTGSQLYLAATDNTVKAEITSDCDLDQEAGVLNVGSVAGRIDVYFMLQIMQYTPVANSGATGNKAEVTCNGEPVEAIIAALPELNGEPVGWINYGEYEIAEGYTVPSNIEAIIDAYGSYAPLSRMMPGIVWITVE